MTSGGILLLSLAILLPLGGWAGWLVCRLKAMQTVYWFHNPSGHVTDGYVYFPLSAGKETFSSNLQRLLGLAAPPQRWEDILSRLQEQDAKRLQDHLVSFREYVTRKETSTLLPFHTVITLNHNDGVAHYFDVTIKLLSPKPRGYAGIGVWFKDANHTVAKEKRLENENRQVKEDLHQLSNLLNASPFPIWQRNHELQIKYCNLAYSSIVDEGHEPSMEAHTMELGKHTLLTAKKAKESSQAYTERHPIIVSGQRRVFDITEVPVPGSNGTMAGFGRDITDVEDLEKELRLNTEAQTCLLESSASAMALYGFDTKIKSFNNAFLSLWGLSEPWLTTHPTYGEVLEALREKRKLPEQANFPAFKKRHLRLFNELIEPYNEFFYLPDGTALRVIVIPYASGGLLFTYEDMTDRLAIERSYNTLIAVQRATLDNLYEGVAVFGQNGRIKLFNPTYAQLWRLDAPVLESEPHISYILDNTQTFYPFGNDWDAYKEDIIAKTTNHRSMQKRLERTDGKVLDWTCVPLPDGATLMTYIDVTDSTLVERSLRERNEALEGVDRIKTEFLANVSYELRSPLTTIMGFSEILELEEQNLNQKHKEYVNAIHNSSMYLMGLINDILDLASIEAGYMTLEVSAFNIYEALASVLSLVSERIKEKGLTLTLECDQSIGVMLGDDRRIRQCVFKLLSNAIKFTEKGGKITLGAKALSQGEVMVWIEDTGIGIAPEAQASVFQKFYKTEGGKNRNEGAGLGLSVVKSFVTLHGGRIELESFPGEGTCFRCIFPRENKNLLDQPTSHAPLDKTTPLNAPTA